MHACKNDTRLPQLKISRRLFLTFFLVAFVGTPACGPSGDVISPISLTSIAGLLPALQYSHLHVEHKSALRLAADRCFPEGRRLLYSQHQQSSDSLANSTLAPLYVSQGSAKSHFTLRLGSHPRHVEHRKISSLLSLNFSPFFLYPSLFHHFVEFAPS
jgi:hypothetical protein